MNIKDGIFNFLFAQRMPQRQNLRNNHAYLITLCLNEKKLSIFPKYLNFS